MNVFVEIYACFLTILARNPRAFKNSASRGALQRNSALRFNATS